MNDKDLKYFKEKLINQKEYIEQLLYTMKKNDTINSNRDMENELSNYDNHPADAAGNLYDKERGLAFKDHEMSILKKIDNSLDDVEKGTYGTCKMCHKDILRERLEFIPYTQYCAKCQKEINDRLNTSDRNRCVEESVLGKPFGYGYNDLNDKIEFDAEDSYQSVERFNRLYNISEYYDYDDYNAEEGYVESVERVSNMQYKNQLPD
ncbi:TraR/DksA C4-type zinc finger protein [Haloimpatiens sp. FM7330]|uniref:TraR/DksA C4-type zinc finger protein n=1 Tax=Haloimpatiens sp. FM7330 TaxID=3298610 RepID=UPI003639425A